MQLQLEKVRCIHEACATVSSLSAPGLSGSRRPDYTGKHCPTSAQAVDSASRPSDQPAALRTCWLRYKRLRTRRWAPVRRLRRRGPALGRLLGSGPGRTGTRRARVRSWRGCRCAERAGKEDVGGGRAPGGDRLWGMGQGGGGGGGEGGALFWEPGHRGSWPRAAPPPPGPGFRSGTSPPRVPLPDAWLWLASMADALCVAFWRLWTCGHCIRSSPCAALVSVHSGICQGMSWQHLDQPCVAGKLISLSVAGSPPADVIAASFT